MKTKKSITTRFRVTRKGKVLRRNMAQCHFRSKKTATQMRRKDGLFSTEKSIIKKILKKPGAL